MQGIIVDYSPEGESHLQGFKVTLNESLEMRGVIKFKVDNFELRKWMRDWKCWNCPKCGRRIQESKTMIHMAIENHIHMSHGYELPDEHPLSRRTRMQKLMDWIL